MKNFNNDVFWLDPDRKFVKTYEDLISDLRNKNYIRKYIFYDNPYDIFLEFVHSILTERTVELLDMYFHEQEIINLGLDYSSVIQSDEFNSKLDVKSFDEILEIFSEIKKRENWKVGIYTSGTTGRPKKVWQTLGNLTRNVRTGDKYKNNVWAFAYNPTHMAGLQVFLQAFYNKNPMIYIFESEKYKIPEYLETFGITHISATPSFYRSLLPHLEKPNLTLQRVTCGGEKYDSTLEHKLKEVFPNAKIFNIYASTEFGTLFSSNGETFTIEEEIREWVKISEEGELMVHKKLLGMSPDVILEDGEWYKTGDIVEKVDENSFRFIHRKSELINVGGYKVNPHEIEEELKKIEGVLDARVYSRTNRITGNILVADVIVFENLKEKQMIEKIIFQELSKKLQEWKIPRIINVVDKLDYTRTGKKVRN